MDLHDRKTTRIVTLSSAVSSTRCMECGNPLPTRQRFDNDLQDHVNHYLAHGWVLLHVGQETRLSEGAPCDLTVAVLGRPEGLPGEPADPEQVARLSEEDLAAGALRFLGELEEEVRRDAG